MNTDAEYVFTYSGDEYIVTLVIFTDKLTLFIGTQTLVMGILTIVMGI